MWIHTASLLATFFAADLGAQPLQGKATRGSKGAPQGKQTPPSGQEQKKPPKPKWPPLKAVRRNIAKDRIPHLVSKEDSKRRAARLLLIKWGPAVCPVLLKALHQRTRPELATQIKKLLDGLVQPTHAAILATHFTGRNEPRDAFIVHKLASFEMRDLLPFFKQAAKKLKGTASYTAWYAIARFGDIAALPFLLQKAKVEWPEQNVPIREALPALHGNGATDWLMVKLRDGDTHTKVAALRLLGGAGVKSAKFAIGTYLDASEHQVRAGAVNALRGILDGNPPYRNLSVFQAIDEVKKWKRRLGRRAP